MKRLAIFASGNGSNAQSIIEYFKGSTSVHVAIIISNKKDAYVLERAKKEGVPSLLIQRQSFYESDEVIKTLHDQKIDFIILAGFLWLIPASLIAAYPNRIINIHPALLPAYGGKGMYGKYVHEAVIKAKEKESGISIHLVNEHYDEGTLLFQASCPVTEVDTPDSLAQKIHVLEHAHYPRVIEQTILSC